MYVYIYIYIYQNNDIHFQFDDVCKGQNFRAHGVVREKVPNEDRKRVSMESWRSNIHNSVTERKRKDMHDFRVCCSSWICLLKRLVAHAFFFVLIAPSHGRVLGTMTSFGIMQLERDHRESRCWPLHEDHSRKNDLSDQCLYTATVVSKLNGGQGEHVYGTPQSRVLRLAHAFWQCATIRRLFGSVSGYEKEHHFFLLKTHVRTHTRQTLKEKLKRNVLHRRQKRGPHWFT